MKSALVAAAVLILAAPVAMAQSLEEKKAEKLKAEFLKKADWILDYDKAREESKKSGKPIFAVFSRSYSPCPACHHLENGALLTEDFAKFAKDVVLFFHVTTMIQGEKYGDLLEEKGGNAFPYIVLMDSTGDVILQHQGERSAEAFGKSRDTAKNYTATKEKADKGDAAAKVDLAILQLSMGKAKADEAQKAIQAAGPVSKEQQEKLDLELTNAEVRESVAKLRSDEEAAALGKKFYARFKEGKPSPTADNALQSYFILLMDAAGEAKDAKVFEDAYKVLFEKYGKMEGAAAFFEEKEKQLKALKK
ncbi:MAG: thioredoxin family protein [Planctomycetaceae bacterium]|nr:thioredoxin family protein [Planctomycetaceae bacterium]